LLTFFYCLRLNPVTSQCPVGMYFARFICFLLSLQTEVCYSTPQRIEVFDQYKYRSRAQGLPDFYFWNTFGSVKRLYRVHPRTFFEFCSGVAHRLIIAPVFFEENTSGCLFPIINSKIFFYPTITPGAPAIWLS